MFNKFLSNPLETGAISSFSSFVHKRTLHYFDDKKNDSLKILEVGFGSGKFTRALINFFPNSYITAVEWNKEQAKPSDSNKLTCLYGDILEQKFNEKFDIIVSTLPLTTLENRDIILEYLSAQLDNKGYFVQCQYSLMNKKNIEKYFIINTINFELINLPPSFIYFCSKNE